MSDRSLHEANAAVRGETRPASLCSFDVARVAAISLVALQHLLTISDRQPPLVLNCLNVGQLGVTVFCGLSGYFSMRSSATSNPSWIVRRLKRVFIPYWISLMVIFVANGIVGYKPVSPCLIVSEFLGTALFTHPGALVGVHVWFISLILICYAIAAVIRWRPAALPLFAIGAVAAVCEGQASVAGHVLSFLAGCLLSKCGEWKQQFVVGSLIAVVCAAGIAVLNAHFAYPFAAMIALLLCSGWLAPSPSWLTRLSESTYEFFLVHGPIYLGLAKYAHLGIVANLAFGTLLAIVAAFVLRSASRAVSNCAGLLQRLGIRRSMRRASR
jgi:hypothetical protein